MDGITLNWVTHIGFGQGYTMNLYQIMKIKEDYTTKNTLLLKNMHSV